MRVLIPQAQSAGYGALGPDDMDPPGSVYAPQFARMMPEAGGHQYGVADLSSWVLTRGTGDRQVRISAGRGSGHSVVDQTTAVATMQLPATTSGSRWHLIVVHRDWQARQSAFDSIQGSATMQLPTRATSPGTVDDQPLYLVRVDAGRSDVAEIVDLRVVHGESGTLAFHSLALQYLDRLGSTVRIGGRTWVRTLDALSSPVWVESSGGRLLGVYELAWFGLSPSGSLPNRGVMVWQNQTQTLAKYDLPDPGVPYRVSFYARGFWGNEFDRGARHDFIALVGDKEIYTWLPAADEFVFGNFRHWTTPPSREIFSGAQQLGFRARRVIGGPYGAVQQADSAVIATVYSA